jgi:hypothetical protein
MIIGHLETVIGFSCLLNLGAFGEEALAIREAMEEDFQWEKMMARQKSKGKRELLNLHSSIDYGDAKVPSRSRKGKAHMM